MIIIFIIMSNILPYLLNASIDNSISQFNYNILSIENNLPTELSFDEQLQKDYESIEKTAKLSNEQQMILKFLTYLEYEFNHFSITDSKKILRLHSIDEKLKAVVAQNIIEFKSKTIITSMQELVQIVKSKEFAKKITTKLEEAMKEYSQKKSNNQSNIIKIFNCNEIYQKNKTPRCSSYKDRLYNVKEYNFQTIKNRTEEDVLKSIFNFIDTFTNKFSTISHTLVKEYCKKNNNSACIIS